jgi:general secretion pathway protein A
LYTEYFGLKEKPFALLPDPRYLFLSRSHREALAHLLYGIQEGEGFMEVVGQVGTGKTTLCRTLLQRVGEDIDVGFIFNPSSSERELLSAINREFGIAAELATRTDLVQELNRFLMERRARGRRVLLVIDEAQNLQPQVLEQIRLISNLETEREKLIQILLFGQPELDENLSRSNLRQLRQRITILWRLQPVTRSETRAYIEHRLRVAGGRGNSLFTPGAYRAIYRASGGVPRLINAVADRALLSAYSIGAHRIDARTVKRSGHELPGTGTPIPVRAGRPPRSLARPLAMVATGLSIGLLAALGYWSLDPGSLELSPVSAAPEVAAPEAALREELEADSSASTGAQALDAVLSAWGYESIGAIELLPEGYATALADRTPLLVLDTESEFERVEELNLPVVLELETASGDLRYVALTGTDATGDVTLQNGGRTHALAREELERHWTGRVIYVWTNFEELPPLESGAIGPQVEWLQERLVELGFMTPDGITGYFEENTRGALQLFQDDHGLAEAGTLDSATLMTMYQALQYGAPALAAGDDHRETL